jgi:hypothetical protein
MKSIFVYFYMAKILSGKKICSFISYHKFTLNAIFLMIFSLIEATNRLYKKIHFLQWFFEQTCNKPHSEPIDVNRQITLQQMKEIEAV